VIRPQNGKQIKQSPKTKAQSVTSNRMYARSNQSRETIQTIVDQVGKKNLRKLSVLINSW